MTYSWINISAIIPNSPVQIANWPYFRRELYMFPPLGSGYTGIAMGMIWMREIGLCPYRCCQFNPRHWRVTFAAIVLLLPVVGSADEIQRFDPASAGPLADKNNTWIRDDVRINNPGDSSRIGLSARHYGRDRDLIFAD